jgi:hypothetical protein
MRAALGCVKFQSTWWSMKAGWAICTVGIALAGRLCGLEHRPQRDQPGTELVPLHLEWNHLIHLVRYRK